MIYFMVGLFAGGLGAMMLYSVIVSKRINSLEYQNELLMYELEQRNKDLLAYRCMYASAYDGFEEMNREFIDAGIKLHVTVESKDALRKLEKLMVSLWHTTREQTREDEELNVHSIESEIYRRIQESENEKEEICYD